MRIVLQLLAVTAVLAGASGAASAQAPTTVPTTVPATQPTRVTVDIPGLPLVEAAEEFSRQTGIPLHFGDPKGGDIEVDIALKDVPVLDALQELLEKGECVPYNFGATRSLPVIRGRPLLVQRPDPLTMVVVRNVRLEARSDARHSERKPTYEYTIALSFLFDPALQVLAIAERPMLEDLVYPDADFRPDTDGALTLQRVDGRPVGVFETELRITSDERIAKFDKVVLRLRAWQAIERTELSIDANALARGGEVKGPDFTVTLPPRPQRLDEATAWQLKLTGPLIDRYTAPWTQCLAGSTRLEEAGRTIGQMRCAVIPRGGGAVELHVGGSAFGNGRPANFGPQAQGVDRIHFSIPTRVKIIDLPIVLSDLPLP